VCRGQPYRVGEAGRYHPPIVAALAREEISESYARAICQRTDRLPERFREQSDKFLADATAGGIGLADLSAKDCVLLCWFHHQVVIHRWGWTLVLTPDGTTTAWNKDKTKVLHSHGPPIRPG
jgi:hypothetical protein